jgi:hypothetical protein
MPSIDVSNTYFSLESGLLPDFAPYYAAFGFGSNLDFTPLDELTIDDKATIIFSLFQFQSISAPSSAIPPNREIVLQAQPDGTFTDVTASLFGSIVSPLTGLSLSGLLVGASIGDINGDGRSDVVIIENREDGRPDSNGPHGAANVQIELSNPDGTYSLITLPTPIHGDENLQVTPSADGIEIIAPTAPSNNTSLTDPTGVLAVTVNPIYDFNVTTRQFLIVGSIPSDGFGFNSINSNEVVTLTNYYPSPLGSDGGIGFAVAVAAKDDAGQWSFVSYDASYTPHVVSNFIGDVFSRNIFDTILGTKVFDALVYMDGTFSPIVSGAVVYVTSVRGYAIAAERSDGNYYESDGTAFQHYQFWSVSGGAIFTPPIHLIGENTAASGNQVQFLDLLHNGLTDFVESNVSNGGRPDVYLNDGAGDLFYVDLSQLPDSGLGYSDGIFADVNSDGKYDLIYQPYGESAANASNAQPVIFYGLKNLTITQDVTIADRHGGTVLVTWSGNDTIYDTGANPTLPTHIDAGAGSNTAVYSGDWSQYFVRVNGDGSVTVSDVPGDGLVQVRDTLVNIQTLQFADRSVSVTELAAMPAVTAVVATPPTGVFDAGKTVTYSLDLSGAVTVTGAPTLTLIDGETAAYVGGSGSSVLTFSYTVSAGDANTGSLTARAVNLNGGSIENGGHVSANLSLSGLSQSGPQIDTIPPTVTAIVESPPSGALTTGQTATVALTLSKAVTVTGAPILMLNDGGIATYSGGSGTTALSFSYTVGAADTNVASLAATAVNLSGGTIRDAAGNASSLSLSGLNQAGPQIEHPAAQLTAAFTNVLIASPTSTLATTPTIGTPSGPITNPIYTFAQALPGLISSVTGGTTTMAAALNTLEHDADASTTVATIAYQFFTGGIPSQGGYGFLVNGTSNPNDLDSPYYAQFNIQNRYINFAANLGKFGDGKDFFTANYGSLSLQDAMTKAYTEIFGFAPAPGKIAGILASPVPGVGTIADYFAFYGTDGVNGIGTKAAAVGWLMTVAVQADLGTYATANDGFLAALALGAGQYASNMLTNYPTMTVAQAAAVQDQVVHGAAITNPLQVADTAANVTASLDPLQALAATGKLTSISLTDPSARPMAITGAQVDSDAGALGKITGDYVLNVSGASAADAAALQANPHVAAFTLSDTAARVAAALDGLSSDAKLSAIALTDADPLTITAAQLTGDPRALGQLPSTYTLAVSGVSVANIASLETDNHVTSISVSDTAAAISTHLDALSSDAKVTSINLTDDNPLTIFETVENQLGLRAIGLLTGAYALAIVGRSGLINGFGLVGANHNTIDHFSTPGSSIDAVDMNSQSLTATFAEGAAGTSGDLLVSDGTLTVEVTLIGQFDPAGFSGAASAAGFVLGSDGASGTMITWHH